MNPRKGLSNICEGDVSEIFAGEMKRLTDRGDVEIENMDGTLWVDNGNVMPVILNQVEYAEGEGFDELEPIEQVDLALRKNGWYVANARSEGDKLRGRIFNDSSILARYLL